MIQCIGQSDVVYEDSRDEHGMVMGDYCADHAIGYDMV